MTAFPWARPGHCRDCEWLRQTYDTALAGLLKGDLESCPSSFRLYRTLSAGLTVHGLLPYLGRILASTREIPG